MSLTLVSDPRGTTCALQGVNEFVTPSVPVIDGNFTVMFWAKFATDGEQSIIEIEDTLTGLSLMFGKSSAGQYNSYQVTGQDGQDSYGASFPITTGAWSHFALVHRSVSFVDVYRNGVLVDTIAGTFTTSYANARIKMLPNRPTDFPTMLPAYFDVILYPRSLGADSIEAYNLGANQYNLYPPG